MSYCNNYYVLKLQIEVKISRAYKANIRHQTTPSYLNIIWKQFGHLNVFQAQPLCWLY